LGPTLFKIFINKAPSTIENKILLYADDSIIIGPVHDPQSAKVIHADFDALSSGQNPGGLNLNIRKCSHSFWSK